MKVRHRSWGSVLAAIMWLWIATLPVPGVTVAEELKVEGLPAEAQAFKSQVQQILAKADAMIKKLRDNPEAQAIVLDLMQTRDNVAREMLKAETTPDGAKWTAKEGRSSIEAMLKLLKVQYEKASSI